MKKLAVGILAHVDAGKTTLSESILYHTGSIPKIGRVDHKDTFLDTFSLEKQRGITIFSKQAIFSLGDLEITLLDTPGHVDFSAEMERTLQVLDYAILVVNGAEGVQGHTETLWKLLKHYQIPVFLFINKMDQDGVNLENILLDIKRYLADECILFEKEQPKEVFQENIAMCDEEILEQYLETENIEKEEISRLIFERKIFPCYFGSALKQEGIKGFLEGMKNYLVSKNYNKNFEAKIYKVSRDEQGNRLTHMKITGGKLRVKDSIEDEKVNQIRIYSGEKYRLVNEIEGGGICAVTGLSKARPGEGLGVEAIFKKPLLEPILTYKLEVPKECDPVSFLQKLQLLEEENPQVQFVWKESLEEIHVQVMGEIQAEILKSIILERFDINVDFSKGNILYKESILEPVEGVGHFEPLRHYAEVHFLLEPLPMGSGLVYETSVSDEVLEQNWQKLVLANLKEKEHKGVLVGAPITDMKITLIAGRAHQKHTEGGDFREASYRALRQGLMKAKSVLLEPYYEFRLEVPSEMIGRAMSDIKKANGRFQAPSIKGEMAVLKGCAPAVCLDNYQLAVQSYTSGRGRFFCTVRGYEPCHNPKEVMEEVGYDPKTDMNNPSSSIFCSHGAGFGVSWEQVEQYMHVESNFVPTPQKEIEKEKNRSKASRDKREFGQEEKELEEIFRRTYKAAEEKNTGTKKRVRSYEPEEKKQGEQQEYLLVDGYNIIFSWDDLRELAEKNIDAAKSQLIDILCNYQGYKQCILILVFDAYKVEGHVEEIFPFNNIFIVYTKEAETADQYIEKTVYKMKEKKQITVATSDGMEQIIITGQGAALLSAREFRQEIERTDKEILEICKNKGRNQRNYLFQHASKEMADQLEEIRLGKV